MSIPVVPGKCGRSGVRFGAGFTLIELLIVVVIVAILAAIALPSYQNHMRKARRAQAKADLNELAQLLEREYTINRTYAGFTLPFANSPREIGSTVAYTITDPIPDLGAKTYTLTVVPTGPQAGDVCGTMTLDQTGAKTPANSVNPNGGCW
jgi:type IV pilus assembly protein PilE